MGVAVSKKTNSRTKKVQQTASVVAAWKVQDSKSNKVESSSIHNLQNNKFYSYKRDRNGNGEVNVMFPERRLSDDKKAIESLTYGLPTLKEPLDTLPSISDRGITGNWEKSSAKGREDFEIVTIPYFDAWNDRVEFDELCTVCSVFKSGQPVHPCRVCAKVFHEECLKLKGKLNGEVEQKAFARANTAEGWSCHDCELLTGLLTDDEMRDMIENFDRLDVNQDSEITEEEFMRYRKGQYKQIHNVSMPSVLQQEAKQEFEIIDKNKTGTIDWWEFLNHESAKVLGSKRSQFQLVSMLTPREIQEARDIFHAFDKDEDGYINSYEAAKGFGRWFGNLRIKDAKSNCSSFGRGLDSKAIAQHVDHHTNMLMSADKDNNRLVSWEEYLREQALYIIAGRPN